ncbi:CHAT domain-containing protein, partial [Desulfosarcina sp. OttesenSCG-928-G10]|nr:CHAT domain-containing protein [Desulfosarcina sp. OttesenSCG-928-G10]
MQIQIRHSGYKDGKPEFVVVRGSDVKQHGPVCLTPPEEVQVEGRPDSNLRLDLQWYLEKFLEWPIAGDLSIAERTEAALKAWGTDCFQALFQDRSRDWFQNARNTGLEKLTLTISSDAPGILSWPWEALHSPDDGFLALRCRIERQLSELGDTLPLPKSLPQDCINILLIIARPFGDRDIGYHTLARPMVELAKKKKLPVHLDVLRPPTFAQLQQELREKPGHYHIVHFDGHGGYGQEPLAGSMHVFKGPQGKLAFEDSAAAPNFIDAERLSQLLAEHRIPIMVLNACQSATVDDKADDAFASVAASLLKAGVRSVVAMGYSLYVS